jgi:hypothetical protein
MGTPRDGASGKGHRENRHRHRRFAIGVQVQALVDVGPNRLGDLQGHRQGALPHTFYVCSSSKGGSANTCAGKGTAQISPGASATLTINFKTAGSYEYLCTVPGHAAAGMKGDLKVT